MATITGLTAAAMQAIVDATIVGAHITGDDLILELEDGSEVNAGDVRGPQGIQGIQGVPGTNGTNGTTPGISTGTYTPSLSGAVVGTGGSPTNSARYNWLGGPNVGDKGHLKVWGTFKLGTSGMSVTGPVLLGLPTGFNFDTGSTGAGFPLGGSVRMIDNSTSLGNPGVLFANTASTFYVAVAQGAAGTYVGESFAAATIPFTWAANDEILYNLSVPAVRV